MSIVSLVGARPQIIKEAMINAEFRNRGIAEILIHSGQHYDKNMSEVFFKILNINEPNYNLGITSSKHGEMTGRMIMALENLFETLKIKVLILYGDTNTTLAGAIAASKLKIPIAHIEAGLRQDPTDMPEEINRVITDKLSSFLFCPSELGVLNLRKEGIGKNVYNVGDVMYDLFLKTKASFKFNTFRRLSLESKCYIVLTLHRDFNVDNLDIFEEIVNQIEKISKRVTVVWPVHPRTKQKIAERNLLNSLKNVLLIEPLDYFDLMGLIKNAWKVVTDSGGLQKEAYYCCKRSIVLMPDTAWRELVDLGWNKLADKSNLFDMVMDETHSEYTPNIYGEGDAAQKIVDIILQE